MPKVKKSDVCCLRAYVSEFGEEIFLTDDSISYCKIYNVKVGMKKKFIVTQHMAREKDLPTYFFIGKKKQKKRW